MNRDQIMEAIEKMTVLELSELVKAMEDKFGVSASAPVAMAMPGMMAAAAPAAAVEEQTEFDAILDSYDAADKIKVIKIVREVTGLGLKEAKDLVEAVPKPLKTGVPKDEANGIVEKFKEAKAKIVVK